MFIEKAELFLEILDFMWERAGAEAEAITKLLEKLNVDKDARILEVGCGNGRILINLAKLGYKNLVGIDISPRFIKDAEKKKERHGTKHVKFLVGDVLELDKLFGKGEFDVVMFVWTSVVGYYGEEEIDKEIFSKVRYVLRDRGYMLILNSANRDLILRLSEYYSGPYISEHGNLTVIEYPKFDPVRSVNKTRWKFYRRLESGDLKFLDEIEYEIRLYSLHELIKMAGEAGFNYVDAYGRLSTMEAFWPTKGGLNIVFKAT